MTAPGGLLDFFALEAAEHLDRLDALVSGSSSPDAEAVHRHARALRGAATMAKAAPVADLAKALERLARSVRESGAPWGAGHRSAIIAAVDELRTLVRGVRNLTPADEDRARRLAAELNGSVQRLTPTDLVAISSAAALLAGELEQLGLALAGYRARPDEPGTAIPLSSRVGRVRGIAGLSEFPPLPDVMAGIERALQSASRGRRPTSAEQAVLATAAEVIREAIAPLVTGQATRNDTAAVAAFMGAVSALETAAGDEDQIVPIATLFHDDAGPHVVSAAPKPPTTPTARFQLEAVSLAEHLRRMLAERSASAANPIARERAARGLHRALRALRGVAESFGELGIVEALDVEAGGAEAGDPAAMAALDALASRLTGAVAEGAPLPPPPARPATPPARPAPTPARPATPPAPPVPSSVPRPSVATATGLRTLVEAGLAGFEALERTPLLAPAPVVDDVIVPVDRLLYRGRAALTRALELRASIRSRGSASGDELDELLDLLELVGTE